MSGPAPAPPLRIGIVGYGMMGKAHSYGYRVAPLLRRLPVTPVVTVMSGRDAGAVAAAAAAYGIPRTVTDWRELIGRDDVDVVDICTPPGTHAQIAAEAAAAGKAVLCEKPLALSYPEAAAALDAVTRAGVHNAVGFNYRRLPAVALMRRMIAEGAVGEVRLWRATWLSDEFTDPAIPYDWRFDRAMGGTTIADLGSHLIDMALCMAGPIDSVSAQAVTFIGSRASADGGGTVPVTVDDAASALLRFASGARGTMEVARAAVRRPCDFTVEVNGSAGTLMFSYARLNELWYGGVDDDVALYGLRRIRAEHPSHPYAAQWWPIGQGVGYGSSFANQAADLLSGWPDEPWTPGFADGAAVQAVCDAMEISAASGRWVGVSEVLASALLCRTVGETLSLLPVAGALGELARLDDGRLLDAALQAAPQYVRREVARLLPRLGLDSGPDSGPDSGAGSGPGVRVRGRAGGRGRAVGGRRHAGLPDLPDPRRVPGRGDGGGHVPRR